ncbi:response regulator [Acidisoma silvae]|uniref:Response regulator n=1 Tax=Acidisoma silvae TaxID=2802396 RepID=A0A963YWM3_9PROT|nr:response regulator [Acidisoma silvae]MCB8878496.1 response regulator [Acidisoma silvae]
MVEGLPTGCRVLVAEDDPMLAMRIEDLIQDAGGEVIGPFETVAETAAAVRANTIDIAILDLSLKDGNAYPIADMLDPRAVPFIFLSGYGADSGPTDRPNWQWHSKPFVAEELLAKVKGLLHPYRG